MAIRMWITILMVILFGATAQAQTTPGAVVDSRLTPGRVAMEDGFSAVAEKCFRDCLQDASLPKADRAAAYTYLLEALLDQKKYAEMKSLLDARAAEEGVLSDTVSYWRAAVLYEQSKYGDAAKGLDVFGETWPKSPLCPAALRLFGLSLLKGGDVAGATACFSRFAEMYPESEEVNINRLDWGKALIFQGELQPAIDVLTPVMGDASAGHMASEARYWVGKAFLQLGNAASAQTVLAPLVSNAEVTEGLRVKAVLAVGQLLTEVPDIEKAVKLLRETLTGVVGEDSKLELSLALCNVLLAGARLDEAIPLIKAYVSDNANSASSASLQLRLGDVLLNAKRYEEAILVYQQHLEAFSDAGEHARARMGHGWALMGAARYAEAAVAFEKAHDLYTDPKQKMTSLYKVGDSRFLNAQFQQALTLYERFLEEYPDSTFDAEVRLQRGICLESLGQHAEAESAFKALAKKHVGSKVSGEAMLRIGELRHALKDWSAAVTAFESVMKLGEESEFFVKALHGRGMSRYQLWSPDALEDFERIVREYPTSSVAEHAVFLKAMCLYRLGRDSLALGVCRDFLKTYSKSTWAPSVRFWIGRFTYNTGDYGTAETEFLSFAEQFPAHALAGRAIYRAGMAAVKRKEYVHAIELFGQLAKRYPNSEHLPDARFQQADAMCWLGKFAGAILVFEEVINTQPSSALATLAWGRKGDCQFTLGAEAPARYEEAIRSYRVVTQSPQARRDHIWQAEYKIGRSLEKLGREEDAQEHYYSKVMVPFLLVRSKGEPITESAKTWFTRASLGAADIVTKHEDWRKLVRILDRIAEANVAASAEARSRMKSIKAEHWWLFY